MRSRRARRFRVPFGLLLIALGVAVGVIAYLVDRADRTQGQAADPRHGAREPGPEQPHPGEIVGRMLPATIFSDGHPVLNRTSLLVRPARLSTVSGP